MELFVNTQRTTDKEKERLFFAGVLFLLGKAYSDAYSCFDRIQEEHFAVMYNKALCCFMVKWYDECYRLLCEAERLLHGMDIACETQLPEAFLRYDYDEDFPFYPIPQGIPVFGAYKQLLRLKAETAFRLHLYSEVKAISARLGGKYKCIEKLIDLKNGNNDL